MGLDMYLLKRKKNEPKEEPEEVAYWRKANQIRSWICRFTDYSEDANCVEFKLTKYNLVNLLEDCETVLENKKLANTLMPTKSGFFFGNTEYDETYFWQLEDTIKQLEKVINETDWDNEDIFYFEWW